jgi:hypothetical protein
MESCDSLEESVRKYLGHMQSISERIAKHDSGELDGQEIYSLEETESKIKCYVGGMGLINEQLSSTETGYSIKKDSASH